MADSFDDAHLRLVTKECLPLGSGDRLPVIVLLGPDGTDKDVCLTRVWRSIARPESPRVRVDFRLPGLRDAPVVKTVERIAHDLMESSSVRLPRVVFALHVLALDPRDRSDNELASELDDLVDGGDPERLSDALALLRDLLGRIPGAEPLAALTSLIEYAANGQRRRVVRLLNGKGRTWLTAQMANGNVIDLARRRDGHGGDPSGSAGSILCRALVADLTDSWSKSHRHARGCLLLLEGAETAGGRALLKALGPAKGEDPLLVVAESKQWLPMGGSWSRPGTAVPGAAGPPPLSEASYRDWRAGYAGREQPWWYPVLMPPLRADRSRAYAPAVQELTGGHPAVTRRLGRLAATAEDDDAFRAVLCREDVLRWPDWLHLAHLDELTDWAAARNLDDAESALLRRAGRAPDLRNELADLLWLTRRPEDLDPHGRYAGARGPQVAVIHPWLRRLLLHRLDVTGRWDDIHRDLERFHHGPEGEEDARSLHHRLARAGRDDPEGHLAHVAGELHRLFDRLDVREDGRSRLPEWLACFNEVTAAPNRLPLVTPLDELYDSLVATAAPHGRGDWLVVIRALVVDRWFWLDPLLDPSGSRAEQIARGLRDLARRSATSPAILLREADRYEQRW
ncbi:hypothetical protein DMB42_09625 [Nonomuraea sp. WAC 01424]|uniref:hypothetical protein n=1 Tax=Nonomuraea sp. WAC 01424 TaxID=2203200 RepID=UPI000F7B8146|nr:hypothetical protein [Nonomuraea sp. WAC 01424]RSN12474.1 hypothetical protein DMB42_09625 [Nonomuraea sp. WAC 01424]